MLRPGFVHICAVLLMLSLALAQPVDYSNPKSQVEYISVQPGGKPRIVPITRPPLIDLTPPPPPGDTKSFTYNAETQTWTKINPHEPPPQEGTLIWNQSNDKWLTNVPS
ncbi:uncharacterized protein LOC117570322 [Drosophila albomicans]|uniref:Uncharacterized protein LOC117570322 n=1 Tax=Drosophila albomicans TaxID=7291 RepID=A0A6P8X364_DROAB|nr:uncharacterized protein LOC117570322 [Drosophila albomicans]